MPAELCLSVAPIQQRWFAATVAEERSLNLLPLGSWLDQQLVISAESRMYRCSLLYCIVEHLVLIWFGGVSPVPGDILL